jgi:hypothetical protein
VVGAWLGEGNLPLPDSLSERPFLYSPFRGVACGERQLALIGLLLPLSALFVVLLVQMLLLTIPAVPLDLIYVQTLGPVPVVGLAPAALVLIALLVSLLVYVQVLKAYLLALAVQCLMALRDWLPVLLSALRNLYLLLKLGRTESR